MEELCSQFVNHDGKIELAVITSASVDGADYRALARQMAEEIQKNVRVVDEELRDWILLNFSTTSHDDTVVCAVAMMSILKASVNTSQPHPNNLINLAQLLYVQNCV
jgi:hypothetical protein